MFETYMLESWIIVAVLTGITAVANIAVCLYTLYLAKKSAHMQFMEGFTLALVERELQTETEQEPSKPEISK